MIYNEKPENFKPKFEVSSCFVEHSGKILLLHRQDHKPEGNTWGVPAGKIGGEKPHETIFREILEETGFEIDKDKLSYFGEVYVRYPDYDFVYHIFHFILERPIAVTIQPKEHKGFQWVHPKEALNLPLIRDLDNCINLFYKIKNK